MDYTVGELCLFTQRQLKVNGQDNQKYFLLIIGWLTFRSSSKQYQHNRFNHKLQSCRNEAFNEAFRANRKVTHIAMPLAGPCELQLSKGISRVLRGVLGTVPVVDNRCAEVVAESHRGMGIPRTPTLAQRAITARGERIITRSSLVASTQSIRPQRNVLHRVHST